MSNTPKPFFASQPGTTIGTLYTASSSGYTLISTVKLINTSSCDARVTLYFVGSTQTANDATMVVPNHEVPAYDAIWLNDSDTIEASGTIQGSQGTSGAITVRISGLEVV